MTHPPTPTSPLVYPRLALTTTNAAVTIAPHKTALVIIDMQNYFLSAALGRRRGEGHDAEDVLLKLGIPAAREAGIQVIWLNWGISDEGLETMTPTLWRAFGWMVTDDDQKGSSFNVVDDSGGIAGGAVRVLERQTNAGIGAELGRVKLDDGSQVNAGKKLLRDQWNTRLHGRLEDAFQDGQKAAVPDVRFHKDRLSGLWGGGDSTELEVFLERQGIKTLLFSGVNTDQCVLATVQDASNKGFDTVLLKDGCGTMSPDYAKQMVLLNCQKSWGFVSSCAALAQGAKNMIKEEAAEGA